MKWLPAIYQGLSIFLNNLFCKIITVAQIPRVFSILENLRYVAPYGSMKPALLGNKLQSFSQDFQKMPVCSNYKISTLSGLVTLLL